MGLKDSLFDLAGAVASDLLKTATQASKPAQAAQHPKPGPKKPSTVASSSGSQPTAGSTTSSPKPAPAAKTQPAPAKPASPKQSTPKQSTPKQTAPTQSTNGTGPTLTVTSRSKLPGPGDIPMVYDVAALGLPNFSYTPEDDEEPDPGEIVWTWVPYEEDRSQGKDRPVLVLAEDSGRLVFSQLTSKDHVQPGVRQDQHGNCWLDIGSGPWDSRGRPSEARLDRLLCVHPSQVRREGSQLNATRFTEVVGAITELYR